MKKKSIFVVMHGNPVDGFDTYGIFNSIGEAAEFGRSELEYDWFVIKVKEKF